MSVLDGEQNDLTFTDSLDICLSAIGEAPVNKGTGSAVMPNTSSDPFKGAYKLNKSSDLPTPIIQAAAAILVETNLEVESRGWQFQSSVGTPVGIAKNILSGLIMIDPGLASEGNVDVLPVCW